ncbi:sulfotransferase [Ruegeria sediminis]|nr:sulfotransferase [Ruegeria sediminis]
MSNLATSLLRGAVHTVLSPLESRMLARQSAARWPHVFILGAPRSGTSLFYEIMIAGFKFSYFSNFAHRFYQTPLTATMLGQRLVPKHKPEYQSVYGHISGWAAPNEGGWIWRRWLEDGHWIDERGLTGLPVEEIRRTLAGISALADAPFVNKNVMHSNRVRLLDALFPGCLFLEIRRDAKNTARSIIRAQQHNKGPRLDREKWWSVRPSNAGGDTIIERACRQVIGVAQDIERDCAHVGSERYFRIDYENLCVDPWQVLANVEVFLSQNGLSIFPGARDGIPNEFALQPSRPLAPEEELALERMLRSVQEMAPI